jgi:hypothetical protein
MRHNTIGLATAELNKYSLFIALFTQVFQLTAIQKHILICEHNLSISLHENLLTAIYNKDQHDL